jgi:hypothetical protein
MEGRLLFFIAFILLKMNISTFAQNKFESVFGYCHNMYNLKNLKNQNPACEGGHELFAALTEERAIIKHTIDSTLNILRLLPKYGSDTISYIHVTEYWNNDRIGREYIINPEYRFYSVKCEVRQMPTKGLAINADSIYVMSTRVYKP